MTNQQAEKRAKQLWGKNAIIRNSGSFSSPEKRQASTDAIKAAKAEVDRIGNEIKERLATCDWYQELKAQERAAYAKLEEVKYHRAGYRFSVGKNIGWANEILGQGDTWEEAFAKAENRELPKTNSSVTDRPLAS